MITLDLLGKLKNCEAFILNKVTPPRIKMIFINDEHDGCFFQEIITLARQKGRFDIVEALEQSLEYSRRLSWHLRYLRKLSQWLNRKRFFWRFSDLPERILLLGRIK